MRGPLYVLAVAFVCAFILIPCGWSQSATTGALAGVVKDVGGAVLAGVEVSITNGSTGQTLSAQTDAQGRFQFSMMTPGAYEVHFAAKGFATARAESITVNVAETPLVEASLQPGDPAQTVVCQCTVNTSSSSTGTLVDSKTITSVPLTTRNYTQVLSMSSGSAAEVNNAGSLGRGTQSVNVNGNTSSGGSTLDGANAPSAVPNPDTISEFRIQTSQYDAGYGAQVPNTNLITRSGSNQFHGTLWEFNRNDVFNANAFFRNATGQGKPVLKQNQFGATLGGPIRTNRLFFFGSFQGTRQRNGVDTTSISNPILPPLTADRSAAALAAQFCPSNQSSFLSRYATFAGGRQLDCANQNTATTASISPVALRLLQMKRADGSYLIPIPQTLLTSGANAGLGFSTFSLPSRYNENQYLFNADYVASQRNTLSGRSYIARFNQYRSFASPSGYPGAPILPGDGTPQNLEGRDYVTTGRLTTVINDRMVNEARMSFTRAFMGAAGENTPSATSIGMTPANPLFDKAPEITILGALGSFRLFGAIGNDFRSQTDTYSWADNLSWVRGRQTVRMGAVVLTQRLTRLDTGSARGKITFQTFNDFLLGLGAAENLSPAGRSNVQAIQAAHGLGPNGEVQYKYSGYYGSGYFQDDVKVSDRLTLNLGLRWEYVRPAADALGTLGNAWPSLMKEASIPPASGTLAGNTVASNYNPNLTNPYTGKAFGQLPDGVFVRPNSTAYANRAPLDSLAPRFGFAWRPASRQNRLSLRGGYGWFYQSPALSGTTNGTPSSSAPPFAQTFGNTDASNATSSFVTPFPAVTLGWVRRTPGSQLSDRVAGPEFRLPRLQQWNVNAQVGLTQSLSADIGYVGSRGANLLVSRGYNQPALAGPSSPVNCGYDGDPAHCVTTNTSINAKLRVPVMGEVPTALVSSEFTGASNYHSLQATLRSRASHGLSFQAAYTLARARNNTGIYNDQNKPSLDWGRASFDRRQRLTANFNYQVPVFAQVHGPAAVFLKGWTVSGIFTAQSGPPLTLTDPAGGGVFGRAGTSTVTLCQNAGAGSLVTPGSVHSRLGRWIDTSAICAAPVVGSDGSTGYGNSGLSLMDGPGQLNADFSVGKTTTVGGIREDAVLSFRAEFYNAFNHAQFASPGTTLGTATFGVITQTSVAPRLIQFGLKYTF